jgi:hypothetical protein
MTQVPLGRPPLPRVRVRAAFVSHIHAYLRGSGLSFRQVVARAFGGDDSDTTYYKVLALVNSDNPRAVAASLNLQVRLASIAAEVAWPSSEPVVEPLPKL